MSHFEKYKVIYRGNVHFFEDRILYNSEQEIKMGKMGPWCKLADMYARQLTIISINPFPESDDDNPANDEPPPSLKHINKNTVYENFYRWGLQGGSSGNHRIIYAVHNYYKVVLLYHFDKQYNGRFKRNDIIPAELEYETYCASDPLLY